MSELKDFNKVKGYLKTWDVLGDDGFNKKFNLVLENNMGKFDVTVFKNHQSFSTAAISSADGNAFYTYDENGKIVHKEDTYSLKGKLHVLFNLQLDKEVNALCADTPIRDFWIVGFSNGDQLLEYGDAKTVLNYVIKNKDSLQTIFKITDIYFVGDVELSKTIDKHCVNSNLNGKVYYTIIKFASPINLSILDDTLSKINKILPDRKDLYKDKNGKSAIDIVKMEKSLKVLSVVDGKAIVDESLVEKSLLKNTKFSFYSFDDYYLNEDVYEKIKYLV